MPRPHSARAGYSRPTWGRSWPDRAGADNLSEDRQSDAGAFHSNSPDRQEVISPRKRGRSRSCGMCNGAWRLAEAGALSKRGGHMTMIAAWAGWLSEAARTLAALGYRPWGARAREQSVKRGRITVTITIDES